MAIELPIVAFAMKPLIVRPPTPVIEGEDASVAPTVVIPLPVFKLAYLLSVTDGQRRMCHAGLELRTGPKFPPGKFLGDADHSNLTDRRSNKGAYAAHDVLGNEHSGTLEIVLRLYPPASSVGCDRKKCPGTTAWAGHEGLLDDQSIGWVDPLRHQPSPVVEFSGHRCPVS